MTEESKPNTKNNKFLLMLELGVNIILVALLVYLLINFPSQMRLAAKYSIILPLLLLCYYIIRYSKIKPNEKHRKKMQESIFACSLLSFVFLVIIFPVVIWVFFLRYILPCIIILLVTMLILILMWQKKERQLTICLWILSISVISGLILYIYIFLKRFEVITIKSMVTATIFGLYDTFRMFHNEHDFDFATHNNDLWLHFWAWLTHLTAILSINLTLLAFFFRKLIIDKLFMQFGLHEKIYIIKGNDENALCLGRDLADDTQRRGEKNIIKKALHRNLIVYWLEDDDQEKYMYEKAMQFGGIAKALINREDLANCLEDIGIIPNKKRFITNTIKKLTSLLGKMSNVASIKCAFILMANDIAVSDDVARIVDLAKEKEIDKEKLSIHVITSSQWDKDKIETIINSKDKYQYPIHIIDELGLITRQMTRELPPYKCYLQNEIINGKVPRPFKVMVLGFGKMGQAALLRLILNGQFVTMFPQEETPINMEAFIIDEKTDLLAAGFRHKYPGIETLCCKLNFQPLNLFCEGFYNYLNQFLQENQYIHYIVIATDNDSINKEVALEIRKHFRNNQEDTTRMPFIAVITDPENRDSVRQITSGGEISSQTDDIYLFGCRDDIYKEKWIILEEIDKMAKVVHEVYQEDKDPKDIKEWKDLSWHDHESNRSVADAIDTMLYIALDNNNIQQLKTNPTQYKDILFQTKDDIAKKDQLADTLAETEHLRWNAFHATTGWAPLLYDDNATYDYNNRKDLKKKLHACLIPWKELPELATKYGKPPDEFTKNDKVIVLNIPRFLAAKIRDENKHKE